MSLTLTMTSWLLGLGGYAGLLTGLGLFALYGDMSLTYAALLPLCPLIGAGALYTFFHTVLLLIENAIHVGHIMLNEQIVVVMISSVFLGFQACIIGIIFYNQFREARVRREIPFPEAVEEEEQVEEQAEEQTEDTDDDMPGLIRLDSLEPLVEPVVVEPVIPVVEPVIPVVEPVIPVVEPAVSTETLSFPVSTTIAPIASIYMDMVPSLALASSFDTLSTNNVVFTYLDKDLA